MVEDQRRKTTKRKGEPTGASSENRNVLRARGEGTHGPLGLKIRRLTRPSVLALIQDNENEQQGKHGSGWEKRMGRKPQDYTPQAIAKTIDMIKTPRAGIDQATDTLSPRPNCDPSQV